LFVCFVLFSSLFFPAKPATSFTVTLLKKLASSSATASQTVSRGLSDLVLSWGDSSIDLSDHCRELPQVSFMSGQKFSRDKHVFVTIKHVFCRDKSMLVTKKKIVFVATKIYIKSAVNKNPRKVFISVSSVRRRNLFKV